MTRSSPPPVANCSWPVTLANGSSTVWSSICVTPAPARIWPFGSLTRKLAPLRETVSESLWPPELVTSRVFEASREAVMNSGVRAKSLPAPAA
ncbi:MAG: hypothetical protein U0797_21465 [Gemmataceae bacterium]